MKKAMTIGGISNLRKGLINQHLMVTVGLQKLVIRNLKVRLSSRKRQRRNMVRVLPHLILLKNKLKQNMARELL